MHWGWSTLTEVICETALGGVRFMGCQEDACKLCFWPAPDGKQLRHPAVVSAQVRASTSLSSKRRSRGLPRIAAFADLPPGHSMSGLMAALAWRAKYRKTDARGQVPNMKYTSKSWGKSLRSMNALYLLGENMCTHRK